MVQFLQGDLVEDRGEYMSELKKYTDELFENDCRIIDRSCINVLGSPQ